MAHFLITVQDERTQENLNCISEKRDIKGSDFTL